MCEDSDRFKATQLRRKLKKLLKQPFTPAIEEQRLALLARIRFLEES